MPAICLTVSNVSSLKDWLCEQRPNNRASHRAEALAAGLGFRTYAALLAHAKAKRNLPPVIRILDIESVERRLHELDSVRSIAALTSGENFQSNLAAPSWLSFDAKVNGGSVAHSIARSLGLPMILFHSRRKYAKLEWDYITVNPDLDDAFAGRDDDAANPALFRKCQEILRRYPGNNKAIIDCSHPVGWVHDLTIEAAAAMADMLALYFNERMHSPVPKRRNAD